MAVRGLSRQLRDRLVNNKIDLTLRRGELLALVGDNGAGKATLLNILAGYDRADHGEILIANARGTLKSFGTPNPRKARRAGICLINRKPALASDLSTVDNILLGTRGLLRPGLARRSARKRIAVLQQLLNFRFPIDIPVEQLPVGDRLRVEVLRAIYSGVRILALDEPTAVLPLQDSESLFDTLRKLAREEGLSVVFTTRKVDEARKFADRIAVLRGGHKVADAAAAGQDRAMLMALAMGRIMPKPSPGFRATGEPVFEVEKIEVRGAHRRASLNQVSFDVRAGEIVGIAGIPGNGQDTLAALASGRAQPDDGKVSLFGTEMHDFNPIIFMRAGVAQFSEDSFRTGMIGEMSLEDNLVLEEIRQPWCQQRGLLQHKAIRAHANETIARHELDCPRPDIPAAALPFDTILRLAIARSFDREPRLLIAHRPTHGLSITHASDIHRRLTAERDGGVGILLISEDIDELLTLSDSIGVLYRGRLSVPQPTGAFDARSLGLMMGGQGSMAFDWTGWGDGT
jgi:simple sugar transport system ATP-binding protein